MSIRIIGDVHGKYNEYEQIAQGSEYSVCLGDFVSGAEHLTLTPFGKRLYYAEWTS